MARGTPTKDKGKTDAKASEKKEKAPVKKRAPSSTGKRNPKVEMASWRREIQRSRVKFDDDQKKRYLEVLAETGLKGLAASSAGVSQQTVNNHIDNDPDLEEAVDKAIDQHRHNVSLHVQKRGMEGWMEPVFSKGLRALEPVLAEDGSQRTNEAGEKLFRYAGVRKFSDRMLELEAKRVDPTYRDKSSVDLNTNGPLGVMMPPTGMTPEEQEAEGEAANAAARVAREAKDTKR